MTIFCERGILLDSGKIRVSGPVQQVVETYLTESTRLDGEMVFPEDPQCPGNKLKFLAVRILGTDGHPTAHIDLLKGFTIQIEYKVWEPVRSAEVGFELWNSMGVCVLCSGDFDEHPEDSRNIKQPDRYRASCFIPPTYLRRGQYWINLGSSIPGIQVLDEVHNAITFEVMDTGSVEFKLSEGRRGVILPILKWNTHSISGTK